LSPDDITGAEHPPLLAESLLQLVELVGGPGGAKEARRAYQGGAHEARPVGTVDDHTVSVPVEALGHLVMAASQAGKYASLDDDGPAVAHLLDLATEIGAALVRHRADGVARILVGALDELAELVDTVADRIEENGWNIWPCGEGHDQDEVDAGTTPVMRNHAALARGLREQAAGLPAPMPSARAEGK